MDERAFYAGFKSALPGRWSYDGASAIDEDGFVSVVDHFIWVAIEEAKAGQSLEAIAKHINVAHSDGEEFSVNLECGLVPSLQMRFASAAASPEEYRKLRELVYPFLNEKLQFVWRHWESSK
jgi:hypothetical protein